MSAHPLDIQPAGWAPAVFERLQRAAGELVDADIDAPVAVFDFDNTLIRGDIGELFSHYLIDEVAYRYDLDAFWALIDEADGRGHIRSLTERLLSMDPTERRATPDYRQYLAEMGAVYGRKYAREGKAACYRWAVRLHVGLRPADIRELTHRAIDREVARALEVEERTTTRGETVRISRGIRRHAQMRELIDALERVGFDVWVVSATNQWSVEAFAERAFGVPRERVLGNRVAEADDGILTDRTLQPVLFGDGKVDIIAQEIGRRPALVFGDSTTDLEMMRHASHLGVLIDRGEQAMRDAAEEYDWAVQPQDAFEHERGI
ncbi:MAG: HAD family hydrolase [Myxococcota bacterium]